MYRSTLKEERKGRQNPMMSREGIWSESGVRGKLMLCGSFTNVSHLLVTRWGHSEYLEPSLVEINLHRILNSFSVSTAIAHTQKHSSNGSIVPQA